MFVASGLTVLSSLILAALDQDEDPLIMIIAGLFVAVIFLGLGFWAKTKPLASSIIGLSIYGTLIILSIALFIDEGGKRFPIGVLDIVIVAVLIKGIVGSLKAERFKKEKGWDWTTSL